MTGTADAGGWQRVIGYATAEFEDRHPRSRDAILQMCAWLPGGDTRSSTWFDPSLVVRETAKGAEMTDVDGDVLPDLLGSCTRLVNGHRPPFLEEAVRDAPDRGFLFGSPAREQGTLAEHLIGRLPAAERARFTDSGTEATLLAARAVRHCTGRHRLTVARYSCPSSCPHAARCASARS